MSSSPFLARASPGLDEGKWAMGMVEKGMVKRFFQHPPRHYRTPCRTIRRDLAGSRLASEPSEYVP
jgi:hypothetical protein